MLLNPFFVVFLLKRSFHSCWRSSPFFSLMSRFPISRVTLAVPWSTIPMMVAKAFGDRRSVGEIKFPAALFKTRSGKPNSEMDLSTAVATSSALRTSILTGNTCFNIEKNAVFWGGSGFQVINTSRTYKNEMSKLLPKHKVLQYIFKITDRLTFLPVAFVISSADLFNLSSLLSQTTKWLMDKFHRITLTLWSTKCFSSFVVPILRYLIEPAWS